MSDVQRYLLKADQDKNGAQQIAEETALGKMLHRLPGVWVYVLIGWQVSCRKRSH